MSVFDDPKKELEQLQKQLLQDEAWFEKELDAAHRLLGDEVVLKNPAGAQAGVPGRRARTQAAVHAAPRPVPVQQVPKTKGIRGLVVLAVLETLGIVAVAAYWVLVLLK